MINLRGAMIAIVDSLSEESNLHGKSLSYGSCLSELIQKVCKSGLVESGVVIHRCLSVSYSQPASAAPPAYLGTLGVDRVRCYIHCGLFYMFICPAITDRIIPLRHLRH